MMSVAGSLVLLRSLDGSEVYDVMKALVHIYFRFGILYVCGDSCETLEIAFFLFLLFYCLSAIFLHVFLVLFMSNKSGFNSFRMNVRMVGLDSGMSHLSV
ncbi:hypothetical protein VTJ04DRAFT_7513 [Mycothermus thermophilus]|uniref:uncharacterized protein n=1 Tax=Humicola insolens TaxID=85995 RepID=UPI003744058F